MDNKVSLLWVAETGYPADVTLREHSHQDFFQIYYIMGGSGTFVIDGKDVAVEPDMLLFFAPGLSHGIRHVDSPEILEMVETKFVVFDPALREALISMPAVNHGNERLKNSYYEIFLETIQKSPYYEARVPLLLEAWLYQLLAQCRNTGRASITDADDNRVSVKVKRYIDEHFSENILLDDLAELTGYSKGSLCKFFRNDFGTTINKYLNDVRISHAINMLYHLRTVSVAEIAEQCGFTNVFYFIKAFKKAVGVPPGSFRGSELAGADHVTGDVSVVSSVVRSPHVVKIFSPEDVVAYESRP